MASLEELPPDQRAVLQMVLQRGRSYEEIASLLSIERAAVRQRALDGCQTLTPDSILPGPEHALVTDYLLGQLPAQVAEQVYAYLDAAPADREWAQAIAQRLSRLSARGLPEIPVGAPLLADGPYGPDDATSAHGQGAAQLVPASTAAPGLEPAPPSQAATEPTPPAPGAPASRAPQARPATPPSARRGGVILLSAVGLAIAVAVVVVIATSGGSSKPKQHPGTKTAAARPTTTSTRTGTTTTPRILAALNLSSPTGATKTEGVAQVIREDGVVGIVIDAQGVPANGAHNAYGVWLYNSRTSAEFAGFDRNLVGNDGKLAVEGELPANAAHYKRLLITLETQPHPKTPGEVVLSGPFREHP